MSKPYKLPPIGEIDELDYEQKVNYKLRIFETIFQKECQNDHADIDKVLEEVDHIYEELTKNK